MNFKKISRQEKESLYIKGMTKLQIHWNNPLNSDWDFIKEWSDEELEKWIVSTVGQLKFENSLSIAGWVIKITIFTFVILGIVGLLVFGIRQLF